jgi:fatty-acyl-CoA synthase
MNDPTRNLTAGRRQKSLTDLIEGLASGAPEAAAIHYGIRTITYGDLAVAARRVATGLAGLGVGPGDRVAVWLPNVPAWYALEFACARMGAIAVAVNTRFRSSEVEDIVGRSGARVLVLWPDFKDIDFMGILAEVDGRALEHLETVVVYDEDDSGDRARPALPGHKSVSYRELESSAPYEADHAAPELGCNIFTTSGTTKAPKFVLHSQASVVDHAALVASDFGLEAEAAVSLQAIPLCGIFGFCQAMAALAAGRPTVLMPSFDAAAAADLIERFQATHLIGSDDMFHQLLAARSEARPFPSLRLCGYGNFNPAREDIVAEAAARGVRLIGLYGMSEVQALFARQRVEASESERARNGGYPVASEAQVRVRDPESGKLLDHGADGELEFKGPSLMAGYYNDPPATEVTVTEDGFVRSGDLGHTLDDGSFVFLSRMGDALRLGGFLVNPAEIEAYLQQHDSVEGCQVVGVVGAQGTRAVGFVTLRSGATWDEEELRDWCARGMAKYKVPVRIIVLDAFPVTKSANGFKIQRAKLREMAAAEVAQASPAAS